MEKETWAIRLKSKYTKNKEDDLVPLTFDSKQEAKEYFESNGFDYDYYRIYQVKF